MKINLKKVNEKWKEYALAGCVCVVLLVVLLNLTGILKGVASVLSLFSSVYIGIVIAYVLNPLAKLFYHKVLHKLPSRHASWIISVFLSVIIVLAFLITIVAMLIPQIAGNIQVLLNNADVYLDKLAAQGDEFEISGDIAENVREYLFGDVGLITRLGDFLTNNIKAVISTTTSVGGKAVNWGIGLIMAIYFLCAKEKMLAAFGEFFSTIWSELRYYRARVFFEKFNAIFTEYIVCELIDALIVGVISFFFTLFAGIPNALFLAVVIAVTNLAPTFGPIAGGVIGGFFTLLSAPNRLILFIIFVFALQTLDGYVIKPKLFGDALNIPGVIILIAIIVFGNLMGVVGMLLAIPVAAILVYLYSEVLIPHLKLKKEMKQYSKDEQKKADEMTAEEAAKE